ncbi:MAG: hypothetical protein AAFY88_18505, partial [Acidobacteriota bacterium]
ADSSLEVWPDVEVVFDGVSEAIRPKIYESGFWGIPMPEGLPPEITVRIRGRCVGDFEEVLALPIEAPIRLRDACRPLSLLARVYDRATGEGVTSPGRARGQVKQGDGVLVEDLRFDGQGYAALDEFRFDPAAGPLELSVKVPGYVPLTRKIEAQELVTDTRMTREIEIPLQPAGVGWVILVNAAEKWPVYPQLRDGAGSAVAQLVNLKRVPDQLVLGTVGGLHRIVPRAELLQKESLEQQLLWFRGLSASGGSATPELLGTRLEKLRRAWPRASRWHVAVVVRHADFDDVDGFDGEVVDELEAVLRGWTATPHIFEVGGSNPTFHELARRLAGTHDVLDVDPSTASEAVQRALVHRVEELTGSTQKGEH